VSPVIITTETARLAAQKRRVRRLSRERGAIMFIVAMTLAVIGALGVYALQMSATEIKTAGYIRQQIQSQYLSEYGVPASAQALANNGAMYHTIMTTQPDTACYSLFNIATQPNVTPLTQSCHQAGSAELTTSVVPPGASTVTLLNPQNVAFDPTKDAARGPVGIGVVGSTANTADFFIEVTDPNDKQPPAGYATNSSSPVCFKQITSSTIGLTPTTPNTNPNVAAGYLTEGFEMARARVLFGPLPCRGTK
jgi:hypothetical protein